MFEFNDFLERLDIAPSSVRLLRHDETGVAAWRKDKNTFGCFASFQNRKVSPYAKADLACHFIPGPPLFDGSATAYFVGITRIDDSWHWDSRRMPKLHDDHVIAQEMGKDEVEAFDLTWIEEGDNFCERILVNWGKGRRAWSQWAHSNSKEILEIRLQAHEPSFPGFSKFQSRISEIAYFPRAWNGALQSVNGVYLLVTDTGEQYVGSASGAQGFIGRWMGYRENGHGGNKLLRKAGHKDYTVSILEIASPDMATSDIIARENFWKEKLGSRAFGLNAN